jgi:hypothetical protein
VGNVILLSVLASLNPTLVAATTLMLMLPNPGRLMLGYLAGAMMTSITLGLVIVFSLSGSSSATKATQRTVSPSVDIALGALALFLAWFVRSDYRAHRRERKLAAKAAKPGKQQPRWQRLIGKGSPRATFVVGALLTLPGASYLAGLSHIDRLQYSTPETVLLIVGFNVVMMWMLEVPLLSFAVAPSWTPQAIERAKAWAGRHAQTYAFRGLAFVGVALIIKGVVGLVS